jgi:Copper transport outer membrane protein, MctB
VISFRYHVVSLVAVFLALALGVVVGTTALNGPITTDLRNKVDTLNKQRANDVQQQNLLQQQVATANQFAGTYAPSIVGGTLTGDQVIMIGMPGATSAMKDGVAKEISAAGGTLTGRIQLTSDYTDPKRAGDILNLANTVHPIGLNLPVTDDAGLLGGALISYVLSGAGQQSDISQVLSALAAAQMLKVESSDVLPAKTVVVVSTGSLPAADLGGQTELALVTELQLAGCHTLVAGDTASSTLGGLVALVRGSDQNKTTVSTVDNADTVVGQVSSVLALQQVAAGTSGAYGTGNGAQSIFPPVAAPTTAR